MSAPDAARALRKEATRLLQQGSSQEALQILERALAVHAATTRRSSTSPTSSPR
jgi:hypothetical protein